MIRTVTNQLYSWTVNILNFSNMALLTQLNTLSRLWTPVQYDTVKRYILRPEDFELVIIICPEISTLKFTSFRKNKRSKTSQVHLRGQLPDHIVTLVWSKLMRTVVKWNPDIRGEKLSTISESPARSSYFQLSVPFDYNSHNYVMSVFLSR